MPEHQIRQVFVNLELALSAAGARMENLVKLTIYLTDLADLEAFRRVRDEFISLSKPPASSLILSMVANPQPLRQNRAY